MRRGAQTVAHATACAGVLLFACGDPSHVYEGRLYDTGRGCLDGTRSLDVVTGEPAGTCPAICLVQPEARGQARGVYVSTMCAPYPYGFDTSGNAPECPAALAAHARRDTCLSDGGSTAPIGDAGGDT